MDADLGLALLKRVAAEVITPRFRRLRPDEVEQKHPGDYVTVADREAEAMLTAELQRIAPGALVIGEEAAFFRPDITATLAKADHAFTVDPVDGTGNFVRGNPDHAVMVTELQHGEVIRAWIWQPEHQLAFVAERGAGVSCNGILLRPPVAHVPPQGETSRRAWRGFTGNGRLAPMRATSFCAGVDYPRLATGVIDFLAYKNPKPWDHLPGLLMLQELGGGISHVDGRRYGTGSQVTGSIVAAASSEVLELVIESWTDHPDGII